MRPWEGGERGGHSTAVEEGRTGRKKERERKDNFFEFRTFGDPYAGSFCAFAPMTTVVFGQTSTKLLTENLLN